MTNHRARLDRLELRAAINTRPTFDLTILGEYLSGDDLAVIEQAVEIMEESERDYQADHNQPAPSNKAMFKYMSDADLDVLIQAAEIIERAQSEHTAAILT